MKKKFALCTAVLMLMSVSALPVSAADDTRTAVISTTVEPTYVVTIPADLKIPFNQEKTNFGEVKLDSAQIEVDKCVKVTMISDNTLKNKADKSKTIPYKIYEEKADSAETVFTTASYLTAGEKTALTIGIEKSDWNKAYAGEYEDTVTFQIEYTDNQ